MESPSLILLSYQDALQRSLDVVANNVANGSTTGYKRQDIQFQDYMMKPQRGEELNFVINRGTVRDVSMGSLSQTGNPLDLAIQGEGYFEVQTKNGPRYTRSGSFITNDNGEIVTPGGDKLMDAGGQPIVVGPDLQDFVIGNDGTISGNNDGATEQIGRVKVATFKNEQELQYAGNGQYTTTQTPTTPETINVVQGMIEKSNVEPVAEMTRMLTVLRSYQQVAKMMDAETSRLTDAISKLSKASA